MNKYKVGDIVKLRDDLEVNKFYGKTKLNEAMVNVIGKKAEIKEICKSKNKDEYYAKFASRYGGNWFISDEMIEGLWEESCQQVKKDDKQAITGDKDTAQQVTGKLKLIDILNKIANGEIKEGTKVIYKNNVFDWDGNVLIDGKNKSFFGTIKSELNEEVELIEPDHLPDVGKMAEHLREDTKMIEPTDNTKIEELDVNALTWNDLLDYQKLEILFDKLNEVIKVLNKRG
jgi:hypothetical protein